MKRMRKNTKADKKRDALKGAILYTLLGVASAGVLLYLWWRYSLAGVAGTLVLLVLLLDLGLIIPVWKVFQERIKEIEGGEEDAAAEY